MTSVGELAGGEFDWFATDANGAIAIFATAGAGFIPQAVVDYHSEHTNLVETIETPNWGTSAVWADYLQHGLFVYDWKLHPGSYKRVGEPGDIIDRDLKKAVSSFSEVPIFNGEFKTTKEIATLEAWNDV